MKFQVGDLVKLNTDELDSSSIIGCVVDKVKFCNDSSRWVTVDFVDGKDIDPQAIYVVLENHDLFDRIVLLLNESEFIKVKDYHVIPLYQDTI